MALAAPPRPLASETLFLFDVSPSHRIPNHPVPYLLTMLAALVACFVIQTLALRASGGKTVKSESNFFSSVARIQTGASDSPRVMILGSSITGRLPDRSQGFEGVANLGCDGGSALDTLRAIDRGDLPAAPHLLIEANTLVKGLETKETEISEAIRSPIFKVGLKIPQLSATARPSAFAYSFLFQWKIGDSEGPQGKGLPVSSLPGIADAVSELNPDEQQLANEIADIAHRLKDRGTACMIVMLPKSQSSTSINHRLSRAISNAAQIPFWDLGSELTDQDIQLTDGVHMAPASAAATLRTLLSAPSLRTKP